jgi:hypothetical protein
MFRDDTGQVYGMLIIRVATSLRPLHLRVMCPLARALPLRRWLAVVVTDEHGTLFRGPLGQEAVHRIHVTCVCVGGWRHDADVVWAECNGIN